MDIGSWLRDLGLERYAQTFREHEVDLEVLGELTEADLEKLGVPLGHRKKLLRAIARLAEPAVAAEPPRGEAERRQLTVMFVDLVGSTELSTRLDPEDMGTVIRAFQDCCAGVVRRWGGHLAKLMGDGVLVYFGWPQAHEDDAERAVRAGLEVAAAVSGLTTPTGLELLARVGIATGPVLVGDVAGDGAAQEDAVVGETPNLAARLQALADPGTVVVAARTRRLLGGLFALADLGPVRLKGFAGGVVAYRIEGERRIEGRFEALRGGRLTPLVGREHELAMLLERWTWASEGDGQVVLLAGEAGIGKSRLIRALREELAGTRHIALSHFCSPYHSNSALYPVISQLERAAGLAADDGPDARLAKLETLLGQSTDRMDEALPLLAALLGIPPDEHHPAPRLSPQRQNQRTLEVLVEQLAGLARHNPVIELYEDLHWADPSTLELLDLLVERARTLAVLVVLTYRPEFIPPWSGQAHVTAMTMNRLGRRQGAAMVERVARGRRLPDAVLEQIVARTDGVPLFVEELTKAVLESELLSDAGDRLEPSGPLPSLAIPTTLHDSLMARLDRLAPVKEVAQMAAAIGREFSHELLAMVADRPASELNAALDQLVQAELIFRRGTPPDATYSFKHALVQEVAHSTLLKSRRQQLHRRVVTALEEHFPNTPPELLARHLAEAGLDERAADAWAAAGTGALGRSAMREAASSLSRAVELLRRLPVSAGRQRRELELLGSLGVALTNTRGAASPEAQEVHERAGRLARELDDRAGWFRARWALWRVYNVRAQFDDAVAVGEALLGEAGDLDHEIQARHALWSSHLFRGDLQETCDHVDRALALYDVERHGMQALTFGGHDVKECALTAGSTALFLLGYPAQALARNAQGLAHASALGQPQVVGHAHNWGSLLLQLAGDLKELRRRTSLLSSLAEEHGLAIYYPEARFLAAWLAVHEARDRQAVQEMRELLDRRAAMGTVYVHTYFLMLLADAWLRLGEPDAARTALDEALDRAKATGENFCTAELHRLRARALLALGPANGPAEAELEAALAAARQRSARILELRAATTLARLWAESSRRTAAHDLLAPVYGWFTEGLETPDLQKAKALLDRLA